MAVDGLGNVYVANSTNNTISKIAPTGAVSTFLTGLNGPYGVAIPTTK
jgi:DNA-binding beta-propeller fold protein YncE